MRTVGKSFNGPDPIPTRPRQLSPWYPLSHYILNSPPDKNNTATNGNQQTNDQIPVPPLIRLKTESETQNSSVIPTRNAISKEQKSTASPVPTTKQVLQPTVQSATQVKPNNNNTKVQSNVSINVHNNGANDKNNVPQKPSITSTSSYQNMSTSSVSRVPTAGVHSKSPKALNEKESDSSKCNSSEESGPSTAPKKN
jgi:hypothetical protein